MKKRISFSKITPTIPFPRNKHAKIKSAAVRITPTRQHFRYVMILY